MQTVIKSITPAKRKEKQTVIIVYNPEKCKTSLNKTRSHFLLPQAL
jgi:hypothetical protein